MGSVPPELSLDFRPTNFVPKTITDFLREVSMIGNVSEKLSKLDSFLKGLEDELRKIDAFKRELPLCMLLLNDGSSFNFFFFFISKHQILNRVVLKNCFWEMCFGLLWFWLVLVVEKFNFYFRFFYKVNWASSDTPVLFL